MIDNFALGLSHGLLLLAAWRLIARADLDDDSVPPPEPPVRPDPWRPFKRRGQQDDA